jgi:queuosine precursor transporter
MNSVGTRRSVEGAFFLLAFAACVPAANFMIENVGTYCVPDGPCLIPVAPGISAPSGVLMVGLALVLRDLVQRRLGLRWSLTAIAIGTALSATFASPALVVASATAFLLSELANTLVYTPLQRRGLIRAALISSSVGLVVDSLVFLWIAFGSLDFLSGQVIGKGIMVLAAVPVLYWMRGRDRRLGLTPA